MDLLLLSQASLKILTVATSRDLSHFFHRLVTFRPSRGNQVDISFSVFLLSSTLRFYLRHCVLQTYVAFWQSEVASEPYFSRKPTYFGISASRD